MLLLCLEGACDPGTGAYGAATGKKQRGSKAGAERGVCVGVGVYVCGNGVRVRARDVCVELSGCACVRARGVCMRMCSGAGVRVRAGTRCVRGCVWCVCVRITPPH